MVAHLSYARPRTIAISRLTWARHPIPSRYTEDLHMKNDQQIQHDVVTEIEHDPNVPNGAIGVEVHHGVVKLAGHASDPAMKKSAQLAALRVDGVSNVILDMGA
jgi:osmotically-inducible protein OsmY